MRRTEFPVILNHFLSFYPENQNFEKMKKTPGDAIIVHMCTIYNNHIMYIPEIWSASDRISYHFGLFFSPFTPLITQKIKIFKNEEKKRLEILSFYKCVP